MRSYAPIYLASELHFLNIDTWNTLWLATCSGVRLAHMLTSQYFLIYPRVRQIVDLAFLSFRISSILSEGIPITALGPLLSIPCPFVSNQHTFYVHLGLLPTVLWLDLLYPWSFGPLLVWASCALQHHPIIREIDIVFHQGSHKAISQYWHMIYYRKKTQSVLSDHFKFFQVYCTDSHHSF